MDLGVLRAVVQGYEDRLFDQQVIAVNAGFWAGYYTRSKKPKPLHSLIQSMLRKRNEVPQQHANEVDVEAFLARERRFKAKQAK